MQSELILASGSPRRKEILELLGVPFEVRSASADEAVVTAQYLQQTEEYPDFGILAANLVQALADAKASSVSGRDELSADAVILAADTIVVLDRRILGKPGSAHEAQTMLRALCGRTHQVYTGVSIHNAVHRETFFACSEVEFYPEDEFLTAWIDRYVAGESPFDKAGGYGIQDQGALFVKAIRGDYYNVMGLPLAETARYLQSFLKS